MALSNIIQERTKAFANPLERLTTRSTQNVWGLMLADDVYRPPFIGHANGDLVVEIPENYVDIASVQPNSLDPQR